MVPQLIKAENGLYVEGVGRAALHVQDVLLETGSILVKKYASMPVFV